MQYPYLKKETTWLIKRVIIYLMAHTPFRGGTDHHLGTDSPRRDDDCPRVACTPYCG